MKILLFSNTNNIENGYGNLTHQFCTYLQNTGISFTLLLPKEETRYNYTTYPVEYILPHYIFDLKTKKIFDYITFSYKTDADIIHSITEFPYAVLAARIAQKYHKALIIQTAGTYGVKPLIHFPDKLFLKWAYSQADFITPISDFTAQMIKKLSGTKTPMQIIHPGVDFKKFDKQVDTEDIRKKYGTKKILLTVGVLKPRKGHDVVLKALGVLKQRRQDFHYIIVGSQGEGRDTYYKTLEDLVDKLDLKDNVTFSTEVHDNELVKYFHAAYLYIHTPRVVHMNFEGFGIVYLEAGASRKPVIGADSGGVRDALVPDETGLLVPENNPIATATAIEKLLDDPTLAQKMGEAGYRYAQQHQWEKIGAEYVELYKKLSS